MAFVIDASVALAWYFREGAGEATDALREKLTAEDVHVPVHWALEIVNAILTAVRSNRVARKDVPQLVTDLRALPDEIDQHTTTMVWIETMKLADKHRLTSYDAAYLELARRKSLPLATLDKALAAAAKKEGTKLLI